MRLLPPTALVLLGVIGGLIGAASDYDGLFPALGGPNGLLYDLTLAISRPWRQRVSTIPVIFIAVDKTSLSRPDLARLPRALFQPIWARLIHGLMSAGARRIAFDLVFPYAGSDFRVGNFALPDYDRTFVEALRQAGGRVILGEFPDLPPAPIFLKTVGPSRVGVLDLQAESDGIIRSVGAMARLADGRIAFGFAALSADWSVSRAAADERLLIAPSTSLHETPTYSLGVLLDCLGSPQGLDHIRRAVEGRVAVVGTSVLGEDEHSSPTRFFWRSVAPPAETRQCEPGTAADARADDKIAPGALLQVAAIQSAASAQGVSLAPLWLRAAASVALALVFAAAALREEGGFVTTGRGVSPAPAMLLQLLRSTLAGLLGPILLGGALSLFTIVAAARWLPLGYPIVTTSFIFWTIVGLRWGRDRALFGRLLRSFGRYLPPARVAALARSGFTEPPKGQEREVTILLADLIDFTSFTNAPGVSASEVVAVAGQYFAVIQRAIDRHGGCCDKFLGDAVLAFWNGISDEPDHAAKGLEAARDILNDVNNARAPADPQLEARVIVNSGRVYVGDIGTEERSDFTIMGPAVNELFRMEKLPDIYGVRVLIGGLTVRLAKSASHGADFGEGDVLRRLDDIMLKGFKEPRSIYTFASGGAAPRPSSQRR